MTIFTGCTACNKAISFDLPSSDIHTSPGDFKRACKVRCEYCGALSDVMITILPTGESNEVL